MSRVSSRLTRPAAVGAATTLLALGLSAPAVGHGGDQHEGLEKRQEFLAGAPTPVLTSDNVEHLGNVPDALAISGDFSLSTRNFYASTLKSITVYDISDPAEPRITGVTDNFTFENEAMNYGEQTTRRGALRQFVLVGVDLHQASTDDPQHVNAGDGKEIVLVDVTDPTNPHIRSRAPATTSTHTVACVRKSQCRYAYTAGSRGTYSIFDLRDWNNPKEVDSDRNEPGVQGFTSPALDPNEVFSRGAGHKWNFPGDGLGYHTGSGGTAIFDVRQPRRPQLLTTTTDAALKGPWDNFIHHNSWQPNVSHFRPGTAPELSNGNVLLVTEEDYEQTDCSQAGSFQTWKVANLDGPKTIRPLDRVELSDLGGPAEGVTPQGGFCSAHWFDYHPAGIVAVAYYNGGVRLVDVRDPRNITSFGFAQGFGETWDSYWVPRYNRRDHAMRAKTKLLYSVDLVRGLDVYRVNDLPTTRAASRR